jgi:hypothetical protein
MPRDELFQLRAGVAALWTERNPVLEFGEPGIETDTRLWKTGDGITPWNDLDYMMAEADLNASIQELVDAVEVAIEPPIDLNVLVLNALT